MANVYVTREMPGPVGRTLVGAHSCFTRRGPPDSALLPAPRSPLSTFDIQWREATMELLDLLELERPEDPSLAPKARGGPLNPKLNQGEGTPAFVPLGGPVYSPPPPRSSPFPPPIRPPLPSWPSEAHRHPFLPPRRTSRSGRAFTSSTSRRSASWRRRTTRWCTRRSAWR